MIDEERIKKAIETVKAQGKKVMAGDWGVYWDGNKWAATGDCMCPIGAILVTEQIKPTTDLEFLGLDEDEGGDPVTTYDVLEALFDDKDLELFVLGFDGRPDLAGNLDHPAYKMGRKLRGEVRG